MKKIMTKSKLPPIAKHCHICTAGYLCPTEMIVIRDHTGYEYLICHDCAYKISYERVFVEFDEKGRKK